MQKLLTKTSVNWASSYEENNYGELFYALVRLHKPNKIVELGTKAGYSAYHLARGLYENRHGTLDCYDLWENYEFNSVPQPTAQENLKEFKDLLSFTARDAVNVEKLYTTIDILHVDLSNDGGILEKTVPQWIDKVRDLIILEGGSVERDNVGWMIKYKKKSIKKWLEDLSRRRGDIEYITIEPYPSVTIIKKK